MNTIDSSLEKMPDVIQKFRTRQEKQSLGNEAQEEKRKALMEEVRFFFGKILISCYNRLVIDSVTMLILATRSS